MLHVLLMILCLIPAITDAGTVNVNVGFAAPPPLNFISAPDLAVLNGLNEYVYVIPNSHWVFFYAGNWYRWDRSNWYRASFYNGPWYLANPLSIPAIVLRLPSLYPERLPYSQYRVNYYDLTRHWRQWDQSRHWHGYDWYRGRGTDIYRPEGHPYPAVQRRSYNEGIGSNGFNYNTQTHAQTNNRNVGPSTARFITPRQHEGYSGRGRNNNQDMPQTSHANGLHNRPQRGSLY